MPAADPKRRTGRPTKAPPRGARRIGLGLKVSAATKARLDRAAEKSGLSQSQEAERRIEASFHYESAFGGLTAAQAHIARITQSNAEQVLRSLGWQTVGDIRYGGPVWLPPGRLQVDPSGWVDPAAEKTPLAPPKLIPDPEFVRTIAPIVEAVVAALWKEKQK
jgi:hypothetical protein